jgi:MFS family permease
LGWIVGVGAVGSLLVRLSLGNAIDRYGPRRVWLLSLAVLAASCFAHLALTGCGDPAVYLLRISYCSAVAGIFGASVTFICARAPAARAAEMIGMLGTSGFLGIVLGTQLGDLTCGTPTIARWQVDELFAIAGALALCAMVFAWGATRDEAPRRARRRPPALWVLLRYNPGTVLLVGISIGVGLARRVAGVERSEPPEDQADWGLTLSDPSHPSADK